jgi:hypothetical protein
MTVKFSLMTDLLEFVAFLLLDYYNRSMRALISRGATCILAGTKLMVGSPKLSAESVDARRKVASGILG